MLIQYEPSAQASTIQIIIGKKVKKNIKLLSSGSLNIELFVMLYCCYGKNNDGCEIIWPYNFYIDTIFHILFFGISTICVKLNPWIA